MVRHGVTRTQRGTAPMGMWEFPRAAGTDYRKLGGLKQPKYIVSWSETTLAGHAPSGGSREESFLASS